MRLVISRRAERDLDKLPQGVVGIRNVRHRSKAY
jgi:hypothetical protein